MTTVPIRAGSPRSVGAPRLSEVPPCCNDSRARCTAAAAGCSSAGSSCSSPRSRWRAALERRVQDRVQAARHREPGGVRPAREVELPQPPGPGADRLQPTARVSTTPQVQQAMEGLFAEVEQKIPDVDGREPVRREGARQISRNGQDRVRARSTSPTAPARSSPPTARRSSSSPTDVDVPGLDDRVRRRHVRRRRVGGASEAIGLLAAMIILLSRSARCSRWACRSSPRCSASAPASRSC